ncbi:MAG: hypothetical protein ACREC0_11590 [Methylocella sp.]
MLRHDACGAAILKRRNFSDSQIDRKIIQRRDEAVAIPGRRFESRVRRFPGWPGGTRRQHRDGRFRSPGGFDVFHAKQFFLSSQRALEKGRGRAHLAVEATKVVHPRLGCDAGVCESNQPFLEHPDEYPPHMNKIGANNVISQCLQRKHPLDIDLKICKWRHLTENFVCKIKEFERIAMRGDKTGQSFLAMIYVASAVINSR